jgi:hypothetical protein
MTTAIWQISLPLARHPPLVLHWKPHAILNYHYSGELGEPT